MTDPADRSWIVEGAEVIVYFDSHWDTQFEARVTKVKKVAKTSFTVEGIDQRIKLDRLESAPCGGGFSCWVVAHPDSDKGKAKLAKGRKVRARRQAEYAADSWTRDDSAETRKALMDALVELDEAHKNYPPKG